MQKVIEKWQGKVGEVVIGAAKDEGGTRDFKITVGGQTGIFFLKEEGVTPNPPRIAFEVLDIVPENWPDVLKEPFKDVLENPAEWARKCVEEFGAELITLRLASTDPDGANASVDDAAATVKKVLEAVKVPLIIVGSGNAEKDNEVVIKCSEAAAGENCLFGVATQDNYKTMTAACLSGRHSIIAESPIDINIAKQLNILISDMQFPKEKIVMHPASGALGYGLEYTYSIMERSRLAALQGDAMMQMPIINFIGDEVWRTKEAKTPDGKAPAEWGHLEERGPLWETATAVTYLHSGSDILVLCHPKSAKAVQGVIDELVSKSIK